MLRRCLFRIKFQVVQYSSSNSNPGINKRLRIFREGNPDLKNTKLKAEDFDDGEEDLMNHKLLQDDYNREYRKISNKIALKRIERQYFEKRATPNFLLWSEKQQIRELHDSEPDEWTYEKLSESFPATPDVIKKIIKAQWRTKEKNIEKHDEHVAANWKAFKENKLDILPHVADHIAKFSSREHVQRSKGRSEVATLDKPTPLHPTRSTTFLDIIRNYNKKGEDSAPKMPQTPDVVLPSQPSETYVLKKEGSKRFKTPHFTLAEMKEMGIIEHEPKSSVGNIEYDEPVKTGVVNPLNTFTIPERDYSAKSEYVAAEPEPIVEKITIPKGKWKKGSVYRVNNCFYADDGEFLYKI